VAARIGIEVSEEVAKWYARLGSRDRAYADRALDRLTEAGPGIRMPHARSLGNGLHELRFSCQGVSRRITYALDRDGQARMLTTFAKQRGLERHEIERARRALVRTLGREAPTARERSR
jgi:hypothetical protein